MTDDNVIIDMFRKRNEYAIAETKSKYGHLVYSVAYSILRCDEDAEECENDTYLGAWNSIPPERPSILSAFLSKIARNIAVTRLRARCADKRGGGEVTVSLNELEECVPDTAAFGDEIDAVGLAELLNTFLRSLPDTERRVFVCRYWRCDPVAEIAKCFGFGQSRVKMMLLRTRSKLREFLIEEGVFHDKR